jgi:hypothetical protein
MPNINGLPKVFSIMGGGERVGEVKQNNNKIQYTVLTAAQYTEDQARHHQ